jgi:hypothetical protein
VDSFILRLFKEEFPAAAFHMICEDNECEIFEDLVGDGRDVFQDIAQEFVWRDWTK